MRQFFLVIAIFVVSCALGVTQDRGVIASQHGNARSINDPQFGVHRNEADPNQQRLERDQEKRRNKERQASLQRDTDKLLTLATELKQYVDKTNENVLSLDVVKKADEIEKLAHSVKEKMRESH